MKRRIGDWGGNILAFAIVVAVNGLSNTILINGQSMAELSVRYYSLFTPAGFTFSIWGLIYLGLLVFVIYQALPAQRDDAMIASISRPFQLNCIGNALWLLTWHYERPALALLIMFVILATLIVIYRRLVEEIDLATVPRHLTLYLPFSLYTSWIVVATLANLAIVQTLYGLDTWLISPENWALLKLALAGAIAATIVLRLGDVIFVLVVAWASFGIAIGQTGTPVVAGAARMLAILALLLAVVDGLTRLRRI